MSYCAASGGTYCILVSLYNCTCNRQQTQFGIPLFQLQLQTQPTLLTLLAALEPKLCGNPTATDRSGCLSGRSFVRSFSLSLHCLLKSNHDCTHRFLFTCFGRLGEQTSHARQSRKAFEWWIDVSTTRTRQVPSSHHQPPNSKDIDWLLQFHPKYTYVSTAQYSQTTFNNLSLNRYGLTYRFLQSCERTLNERSELRHYLLFKKSFSNGYSHSARPSTFFKALNKFFFFIYFSSSLSRRSDKGLVNIDQTLVAVVFFFSAALSTLCIWSIRPICLLVALFYFFSRPIR